MPYPSQVATNKHDLVGPDLGSVDGSSSNEMRPSVFSSEDTLFEELERGGHRPGQKIAAVYTYPDSPRVPGPLSRALFIVGYAESSLRFVSDLTRDDGAIPSCLHKCTVAVKLADNAHVSRLADLDITNSSKFAELMRRLRKENEVAVLGCDKHGRFGILCPMEKDLPTTDEYAAEDFAALCYVGNLNEVKNFFAEEIKAPNYASEAPIQEASDLWQPPGTNEDDTAGFGMQDATSGLWQPPATDASSEVNAFDSGEIGSSMWEPPSEAQTVGEKRKRSSSNDQEYVKNDFHTDTGAAAADRFYSGLTRDLGTRADSRLYHMRSFNGWVKATQIQELRPRTQQSEKQKPGPLRVLDLACGKGGDLGKWVLHTRGVENYVGVDVARGSLRDAAIRVRRMRNKLKRCTFTCADLGADVPGRPRSTHHKRLQELLSWSLQTESEFETRDPEFNMVAGGGISLEDKFDVVSIQFAIHYMMSTRNRARRFFQTVSQLLEVGGNLIATTIDARVVLEHLMNVGGDFHFDQGSEAERSDEGVTLTVGNGACRIHFVRDVVQRIFQVDRGDAEQEPYGLQYTFTLVEGSDHAAGVGDAVNLPEWLTPIPVLTSLASEAGLELEYAQNFHEFYSARCDPSIYPDAHTALYNMKVLDRHGSISQEEWEVSRLYAALKFRKIRESTIILDSDDAKEEQIDAVSKESGAGQATHAVHDPALAKKLFPVAMMKAKKDAGEDQWQSLSSEEKNIRTQQKLDELLKS